MTLTPATKVLEKAGIAHRVLSYDHDAAAAAAGDLSYGAEAAGALGLDPAVVAKTLVVRLDDGRLAVAVVPVSGNLDLKAMAKACGAKRAAMSDTAAAERSSGYVVGGISPLGQRKRLETVIDESLRHHDEIFISAGRRGTDIGLAPKDLARAIEATWASIGG